MPVQTQDFGPYDVKAQSFSAAVPTGRPPLNVISSTRVANLNVDQVDGFHFDQPLQKANVVQFAGMTINGDIRITGEANGINLVMLKLELDAFPDALKELTLAEIQQLHNIGAVTISAAQWAYLGGSDQALRTTDSPTFDALDLTDDISAPGGFKQPFNFMEIDAAANQTAVAIAVLGLVGNTEYVMPYAGSVMGISIASNAARTAGTLLVDAAVNGGATGLQAQLDVTNTQYHSATQAKDADVFAIGERLGVLITTDGAWAPVTADIVVTVIIEM